MCEKLSQGFYTVTTWPGVEPRIYDALLRHSTSKPPRQVPMYPCEQRDDQQLASEGARMEAHSTFCTSVSVDWTPVRLCTLCPWPQARSWHTRTCRALTTPTDHMRRARRHTDFWKIIYRFYSTTCNEVFTMVYYRALAIYIAITTRSYRRDTARRSVM